MQKSEVYSNIINNGAEMNYECDLCEVQWPADETECFCSKVSGLLSQQYQFFSQLSSPRRIVPSARVS